VLLMPTEHILLPVLNGRQHPDFDAALEDRGIRPLVRHSVTTLQINVGKLCNQACHHCHVEAGPKRTEMMSRKVAERVMTILAASPLVQTVDITGGAPELNPHFRWLASESRRMGREVIDRCNLTVFFEEGQEDLPEFLAAQGVEIVASLPCYTEQNVDRQRGHHVFQKSIEALRLLNRLGYGLPGADLQLNLVYNPQGIALPPPQEKLQADYERELLGHFGIQFHRLFTITNMPIKRFAEELNRTGKYQEYLSLLVNHFNPATVNGLMCRTMLSVGYDGKLYDCDFNQMLDMQISSGPGRVPRSVWDLQSVEDLAGESITTGSHCFGCTAGSGSSCGGAIQ
jgi:radical SAM/Cys-rich protein